MTARSCALVAQTTRMSFLEVLDDMLCTFAGDNVSTVCQRCELYISPLSSHL